MKHGKDTDLVDYHFDENGTATEPVKDDNGDMIVSDIKIRHRRFWFWRKDGRDAKGLSAFPLWSVEPVMRIPDTVLGGFTLDMWEFTGVVTSG